MLLNIVTETNASNSTPEFMSVDELIGKSIAVLGITGSGKSNTAAVIAEELLENNIPMTVVDIAGEYWGLKERYSILTAGKSLHIDLDIVIDIPGAHQAAALASFSIRERLPVILDLSGYMPAERNVFLLSYFTQIWREAAAIRKPYYIFLEEASNYINQQKPGMLTDILTTIASEGRKLGLGLVIIGQRSTRIDKNVLSQARIAFIHRMLYPNDIKICQDLLPSQRSWVKQTLIELKTGSAIVRWDDQVDVLDIRQRHTYHGGYTPQMDNSEQIVALKSLDTDVFDKLKSVMFDDQESAKEIVEGKAVNGSVKLASHEWKVGDAEIVGGNINSANRTVSALIHTAQSPYTKLETFEVTQYPTINNIMVTPKDEEIVDLEVDEMEEDRYNAPSVPLKEDDLNKLREEIENTNSDFHKLEERLKNLEDNIGKFTNFVGTIADLLGNLSIDSSTVKTIDRIADNTPKSTAKDQAEINRQDIRFKAMLKDVSMMPLQQKRIMHYLFERDDRSFSLREIAMGTDYALNSLRNRPPLRLVDLGLLSNVGGTFSSTAYETFARMYPDLDETYIVTNFMKVINDGTK